MTTPRQNQGGSEMTTAFNRDLIQEIFGERPELAFLGNLARQGLPFSQEQFLRGRASDFLSRFQQSMGQQLLNGAIPTQGPEQFFGNINFQSELDRFSPQERGLSPGRFAPRTRFFF